MRKRIITLSLVFLFSILMFGQDNSINFTLENSKIESTSNPTEGITVPIAMLFSKDFKEKKIEIINSDNNIIYTGEFGRNISFFQGGTNYIVNIDKDGKFTPVTDSNNAKVKKDDNKVTIILVDEGAKFTLKIKDQKAVGAEAVNVEAESVNNKNYIPGYVLYDAIFINENLSSGQSDFEIKEILNDYGISEKNISGNKHLNKHLRRLFPEDTLGIGGIQGFLVDDDVEPPSSIGEMNVTKIADGLAKFIVKRTKQELTIAFFEKFKKKLDSIKDLQTVFPQTTKVLSTIGNEIYMFKAYIQTLKEAFEKDLATLPSNLPSIIKNHKEFFDANPELKAGLDTSFYIAKSFQEKLHPGVIIENYMHESWSDSNPNYQAAFQTLILFSASLKSKNDSDNYWAPKSDLEKLYKNDKLFEIYLGLLIQNARKEQIIFKKKEDVYLELSDIINNTCGVLSEVNAFKTYVKNMYQKGQSLDVKIKQLKDPTNEASALENYYSIISASIDLMKDAVEIDSLPGLKETNIKEKSKKYFNIVQTSADIVIDISKKNYASVVLDATDLYTIIFEKISIQRYADSISRKAEKNKMTAKEEKKNIDATESNNKETTKYKEAKTEAEFNEVKKALFTYGSFIAAVAQAKTSDEVESAIEAFALPPGSSRIKRETHFNVSLNAYCGIFSGIEHIKGVENSKWNSYGVTAPIGFSISKGHSIFFINTKEDGWNNNKGGWSSSLFLSVVDIGALAAFRFADDTVESVPGIELKDIISPGVFISMGFPKSPISFNVGWQVGPLLRKVNLEENTFGDSYTRFSVSLIVDIPILNLYTKK